MYSKTAKTAHYLPRTGSYSTHPHRNGRVDVLPPKASEHVFCIASQLSDCTQQLLALRQSRDELVSESHHLLGLEAARRKHMANPEKIGRLENIEKELLSIEARIRTVKDYAAELRKASFGGHKITIEAAFVQLAKVSISQDVFDRLWERARHLVEVAKRDGHVRRK